MGINNSVGPVPSPGAFLNCHLGILIGGPKDYFTGTSNKLRRFIGCQSSATGFTVSVTIPAASFASQIGLLEFHTPSGVGWGRR
jgi:hypothetical protein